MTAQTDSQGGIHWGESGISLRAQVPAEKQFHVGFYSLSGGERDRSKAVRTDVLGLLGAKFLIYCQV